MDFAQRGDRHDAAKVLKGFGGAGVLEIVEDDEGGTYRAVYTVGFESATWGLRRKRPGGAWVSRNPRCRPCCGEIFEPLRAQADGLPEPSRL